MDEVQVTVEAGAGGNGCLSFRREKYVPRGGPDGGNGGRGGDVVLTATSDVQTLVDFLYRPLYRARHGEHGKGKNKHGREAESVLVRVPVGTLVWDKGGELLADLDREGMTFTAAKGGRGGRGNSTFATSTHRAPRLAEKGEPGERRELRLELRLLADIGIVGFPNAGKSTLLSRITHARPKIADYPFTTLEPQLGVVDLGGGRSFVTADVPGLLEGASQGKGLGIKFLRHLERTRGLLHLVELPTLGSFEELGERIRIIRGELKRHSARLYRLPQILVLTKSDAAGHLPVRQWARRLGRGGKGVHVISAVTGEGLGELLEAAWKLLAEAREAERTAPAPKAAAVLYKPRNRFRVEERGGILHVEGPEISKWTSMTDFGSRDARERFHRILKRMGVLKELHRRGVKPGDTVFCGGEEMTFEGEGGRDRRGG